VRKKTPELDQTVVQQYGQDKRGDYFEREIKEQKQERVLDGCEEHLILKQLNIVFDAPPTHRGQPIPTMETDIERKY